MPRLIVRDTARHDVNAIAVHIARDNLLAALRFYDQAEAVFEFIATTPGGGTLIDPPIPSFSGLRFWPITRRRYLVLYQALPDGAEVLRVIHGARDLRSQL